MRPGEVVNLPPGPHATGYALVKCELAVNLHYPWCVRTRINSGLTETCAVK